METELIEDVVAENAPAAEKNSYFENYRTSVVSKIAFLIGVRQELLNKDELNFDRKAIDEIDGDEKARTIRNLCILRRQFFQNYAEISSRRANFIPLDNMNDIFSTDAINSLRERGIEVAQVKNFGYFNPTVNCAYINQYISENINETKRFFPEWINFNYIKKLFVLPDCNAGPKGQLIEKNGKFIVKRIHEYRSAYLEQRKQYPYGVFLNWPVKFRESDGNVLYNDAKFLKLLYALNGDIFKATEYVIDAKRSDKQGIYDFLEKAANIAVFVDCENADPYMFIATLLNLDKESIDKIKKIFLIDDVHTSPAWDYIQQVCDVPIEHKETERVLQNKSLVDIVMTATIMEAYYKENMESIIVASSDSDFWGVVVSIPAANFYVLNERRITSSATIDILDSHQIKHCYMDDFALDKVQEFKQKLLIKLLRNKINEFNETGQWNGPLDVNKLVEELFSTAQISIAREQFQHEKETLIKKLKAGFVVKPVEVEGKLVLRMDFNG